MANGCLCVCSFMASGKDKFGFGFGGTGKKSHANQFDEYGEVSVGADVSGGSCAYEMKSIKSANVLVHGATLSAVSSS